MGEDNDGQLPPIEWLVRHHIKALDEFVRTLYPSVDAEPVVFGVFERVERRPPTGDDIAVRMALFGEARALIRQRNRRWWPKHNARAVRDELRSVSAILSDPNVWIELHRLIDGLERLSVEHQEIMRLITHYDDIGSAQLAVILRVDEATAARLIDEASSALRAAFDEGDPAPEAGGVQR